MSNLNEPVWTNAALLSPFVLNDGPGPEGEKTAVRIWYDDSALYLGWTCTDADIQATFTARDSKFWEEEVAEFFVTAGKLDCYWHCGGRNSGLKCPSFFGRKDPHLATLNSLTGSVGPCAGKTDEPP